MIQKKALLRIALLVCVFSLCGCGETVEETSDQYVDTLPSKMDDGVILHAFTWKYNDITSSLNEIKDAGYRIVQTSPVTQPKSNGVKWEYFYQPLSYSISNDSPLGTKKDLETLCTEAHKLGISVIVDIVFNHMATTGSTDKDGFYEVDPQVANYEPYIYENRNTLFHHIKNPHGSGIVTQQYNGLPDIDTSNSYVQERSLSLLKECIDVGVDGFRFDAAKHIETPEDPDYPSSFWVNTLEVAKDYYKNKTGNDLFAYGEILNDLEGGRSDYSIYTKYMKITDNSYCSSVSNSIFGKRDGSIAANASYTKGNTEASKLITWYESHDTYLSSTSNIEDRFVARAWAVIASRNDTNPLFFARTDESKSVGKIGNYSFESELVAVTNRFHNRFVGSKEYLAGTKDFYTCEKVLNDDYGALIIDINGKKEATVELKNIAKGTYWDSLTGKMVTVVNGKANIEFDDSRICFLTKTKKAPRPSISISKRNVSFAGSLNVDISVSNATNATYQINDGENISFTDKVSIMLSSSLAIDSKINLKIKANNADYSKEINSTYEIIKLIDGGFNILNLNQELIDNYALYYWAWGSGLSGSWHNDYTFKDGVMLIDFSKTEFTGFLLALFKKDYVIKNMNAWDESCLTQTADILVSTGFYDASSFSYNGGTN